ncbi:MAG: cation-translocating P-type ATPase [Tissierellia bacterium]|nr:cation-translocating P-type ATPase [Tissierellia bacterium]
MEWYNKKPAEIEKELSTHVENGLSSQEANNKLSEYGKNALEEEKGRSYFAKLMDQFKDPMIIILLAASIVSAIVGQIEDSIIIVAIIVIMALLSLYQEGKAEESIKALQKMASPHAKVKRDGKIVEIASEDLVPGDIVILETGNIVPADLRLFESANLKIDESSLTGESVPVEKDANLNYDGVVEIGDRENMAFSSTIVSYGHGEGIVIATGKYTEIGKIATSIQSLEDEQTPLQKRLAGLSKTLGLVTVGVCALVFLVGVLYKKPLLDMFMTSVSLAVAAIPEGLPAIVTIVLSLGMNKMAKKNAIVKRLLAVETLGTTTVICSDKTGTLTQNEMTAVKSFVDGVEMDITGTGYGPIGNFLKDTKEISIEDVQSLDLFAHIASLTNDASLVKDNDTYNMIGDPTEGALLTMAEKLSINKEEANKTYPRIAEIPFDSDRKMMTTFHNNFMGYNTVSFTKGAPDIILDKCNRILLNGEVIELNDELRKEVFDKNIEFARQALRVLAFAYKSYDKMPKDISTENIENNMIFVGLVGMIDPSRPEAKLAIKECKDAGIIPVMITGDYLETAFAIGKDLGIVEREDQVIMGKELNNLSPEEIREVVKHKRVFARVSPQNKVQIVTAFKENGEIVAMTGDGVNDAPAIKKADIGISMGITGTDVAKNTSDVILTDDNFATIVHSVEEGRIIYANIKKFISFLLSCNIGEILIVLIAILLNLEEPFVPIQLLWLNLVTDSFPALALGVEKGEEDIMDQPPRDPDEPILDKHSAILIGLQSVAITIATLGAYFYGLKHYGTDINGARTVAFATLILSELLRSYSVRSTKHTVFHIGIFSNKKLVIGTAISTILMLIVIYVPGLNDLFYTVPLGLKEWSVILPLSFLPFIVGELRKVFFKHN